MGLGDVAADHDDRRVEEVDGAGQHLAECAPGVAHHAHASALPVADQPHDVAAVGRLGAGRREPGRERLAAGDRLEAADVAAAADHVIAAVARICPMSPAAPRAPRWMCPSATIPHPIPVPTLTSSRCDVSRQCDPVLAAGHDVHVVVDEHRRAVVVREPLRDVEAVPAGHDRRVDRPPGVELDRARDADADAAHVGRRLRALLASSSSKRADTHVSTRSGPSPMSMSPARSASGVPARSLTATRAWVAPRSATRTTPALWLNASTVGGRPPVEALPPAS